MQKKLTIAIAVGSAILLAVVVVHYVMRTRAAEQRASEEAASLHARLAFTPPKPGEVLVITEERLRGYLSVREGTLAVFQRGHDALPEARATFQKLLDAAEMSPAEFAAMTQVIYAAPPPAPAADSSQREVIERQMDTIARQIPNAPIEQQMVLNQQLQLLKQTLATLPDPATELAQRANAELLARYQERVRAAANPAFDAFVGGAEALGAAR